MIQNWPFSFEGIAGCVLLCSMQKDIRIHLNDLIFMYVLLMNVIDVNPAIYNQE